MARHPPQHEKGAGRVKDGCLFAHPLAAQSTHMSVVGGPPSAPVPPGDTGRIVLGVVFAVAAAAAVGGAMPIQRYGLAYAESRVPMLGFHWKRGQVWFMGLILYGIGNGCQAFSLTLGPLFLLGGVFTLLLVFNLLFARLLLKERLTFQKLAGSMLILVGVSAAVASTPENTQVRFSGADLEVLATRPQGVAYLFILGGSLLLTAATIVVFERRYPLVHRTPKVDTAAVTAAAVGAVGVGAVVTVGAVGAAAVSGAAGAVGVAVKTLSSPCPPSPEPVSPPPMIGSPNTKLPVAADVSSSTPSLSTASARHRGAKSATDGATMAPSTTMAMSTATTVGRRSTRRCGCIE